MKAVLIAMELSVYFRPYHHTNSKLKLCYLRAGSDKKVTLLLESLFFCVSDTKLSWKIHITSDNGTQQRTRQCQTQRQVS